MYGYNTAALLAHFSVLLLLIQDIKDFHPILGNAALRSWRERLLNHLLASAVLSLPVGSHEKCAKGRAEMPGQKRRGVNS